MIFFPYKRIVYQTNLEHQQVLDALVSVVGKKRSALKSPFSIFSSAPEAPLKPYGGSVYKTHFDINPVLEYKSIVPMIAGKIEPQPSGTIVQLSYSIHPLLLFLVVIWFLPVGFFIPFFFSAPIFLVGYAFNMLLFNHETQKSILFFSELFKTQPA